ncbi:MAG: hypothetical protein GX575_11045 [Candidatus Anammoximicrobium sp.]|nr:hypothetical protein [Candidatus Anammoximicrobium sp.]
MMTTPPNHGSIDVEHWISFLTDPDSDSREKRDRTMEAWLPAIREAAERVASRFGPRWKQELVDEAPLIIWERRASFDPDRGTFQAFCSVVLYHAFLDIVEKSARAEAAAAQCAKELGRLKGTPADWENELQKHQERRRRTREILDRVACRPDGSRDVHLYAVFLMRLRQGMTVLVSRDPDAALPPAFSLARFIEDSCLVWRSWEQAERFKADWPSLLEIWNELRPLVDQPPHRVEAPELCRRVMDLANGRRPLSPSCWNRWANRAKGCARSKISPEDWDELFAPLLPDSSRSCKREETEEGERQ